MLDIQGESDQVPFPVRNLLCVLDRVADRNTIYCLLDRDGVDSYVRLARNEPC